MRPNKLFMALIAVASFVVPAAAQQQLQQQQQQDPATTILGLRAALEASRILLGEANDRVVGMRGESAALDAKNKALHVELDKLKADKPKADEAPKAPDSK